MSTHTADSPLIVVELLLHQEEVGFELVPLKNDFTHLLLGEARPVGILRIDCRLFLRLASCFAQTGLMGEQRDIRSYRLQKMTSNYSQQQSLELVAGGKTCWYWFWLE